MYRSKSIVVLGAIVALLPALGFPRFWEALFQVLAGLAIVGISVWAQIDKKLKLKAKAQLRVARGKRVTDFYPKTGQVGRRATDLRPTVSITEPSYSYDEGDE